VAEVPLTFLAPAGYDVGLIADGEDDRSYQYLTQRLTNRDTITVEIAPRGGFAARLVLRRPTGGPRPAASAPAAARSAPARPAPARRPAPTRPRSRN
jgi:hypothetical protein